MAWPTSQDYNEAVQDPPTAFADADLRGGQPAVNALGLPMPRSGNFADVYEVTAAGGSKWAVKCFTRQVPGLQKRYHEISLHLQKAKLPFTVDFRYLPEGIRVRGQWYPILKMHWVEGFLLNEFARQNLDKPKNLEGLSAIWTRMGRWLRDASIAHADLQHGNVILVPGSKSTSLAVKLIDYDGMFVPALADQPSGELGHPAYQHPERARNSIFSAEVDRLPLLAVACALRALVVAGKPLWDKYDVGDNMLFKSADLANPGQSPLFHELWSLPDEALHDLVGYVVMGLVNPLDRVPLLHDLVQENRVRPMPAAVEKTAQTLLGPGAVIRRAPAPVRTAVPSTPQGPATPENPWEALGDSTAAPPPRRAPSRSRVPLFIGGGALAAILLIGVGLLVLRNGGGDDSKSQIVQKQTDKANSDKKNPKELEKDSNQKPPPPEDPPGADARFVGRYNLSSAGPNPGVSRFFLTKFGEVMLNEQPRGSWTTKDAKIVLTLKLQSHKKAVLEPKGNNLLIGLAEDSSGKLHQWQLVHQGPVLPPPEQIKNGKIVFLADLKENSSTSDSRFRKNGTMVDDDGKEWPIEVDGLRLSHSLFMHPPRNGVASVSYRLDKGYDYLLADTIVPQGVMKGQSNPYSHLAFEVLGNGASLWRSPGRDVCGISDQFKVPLKGVRDLELRVHCPVGNQFCWAVWVEPRLVLSAASSEPPLVASFNPRCDIIDRREGDWIDRVACSADGRIAAFCTNKREVVIWDLKAGKSLHRLDSWRKALISSLVVAPDGTFFGVGGLGQNFSLIRTDRAMHYRSFNPNVRMFSGALSDDGRFLAVGTGSTAKAPDCFVILYDVEKGAELKRFKGHERAVGQIGFRKDGTIFSIGSDLTVQFWNPDTGQSLDRSELPWGKEILARPKTVVAETGHVLFTAKDHRTLVVWDPKKNAEVRSYPRLSEKIIDIHVAPSGRLAVLTLANRLVAFDLFEGKVLGGLPGAARSHAFAFTADSKVLFSGGRDGLFRRWRLEEGQALAGASPLDNLDPAKIPAEDRPSKEIPELVAVLSKGHKGEIFGLAFSPDGKLLASAGNEGNVCLWDLTGSAPTLRRVMPAGTSLAGVAFSPDSRRLAFSVPARTLAFDITGTEPKNIFEVDLRVTHHPGVAWSPDGTILAVSDNRGFRVLDVTRSPPEERPGAQGQKRAVRTVAFNKDGSRLVSAGEDGTARIWDMKSTPPVELAVLQAEGFLWQAAIAPDGNKVAAGSMNGKVFLWDVSGPKPQLVWSKPGHRQWANSVAFAPDGKTLASTEGGASSQGPHLAVWWNVDGTVRKQWELPERSSQGTFDPTGRYLAITSHNRKLYVLRLAGSMGSEK
jgi:WD40 repeat protein